HRLSFQDNLPRFADRVAFQAAAADTANPAAAVGNQHACAGASIGRAPDLDNRGQCRLARGIVQFPVCLYYTSELLHPLQILFSAHFAGLCPKLTIRKREKQGKSRDYANGRNDVPYVPPIVLYVVQKDWIL